MKYFSKLNGNEISEKKIAGGFVLKASIAPSKGEDKKVTVELWHPETVGRLDGYVCSGFKENTKKEHLEHANHYAEKLVTRIPEIVEYEKKRIEHDCNMLMRMIELHDKEAAQ